MHRYGGERQGVLVVVPTEPNEQRLLVEQSDPASQGMDLEPRLERLLDRPRAPGLLVRDRLCRIVRRR